MKSLDPLAAIRHLEHPPRTDSVLALAAKILASSTDVAQGPEGAFTHAPHAAEQHRREAELLLSEATGWQRTQLLAWPERRVDAQAQARFEALLARRVSGEPIAYIRGWQAFWDLALRVSPATLIPRPETELLVETALDLLPADRPLRVADLGTGSGAIAASLASARPAWRMIATDRSAAALAVAAWNIAHLGLRQVCLVRADWLHAFADQSLDVLVSNPPYVRADDPHLGRGDVRFEPREALTPEGDGLEAYRSIARDARRCLRPGGMLLLEHGYDQGAAVRQILNAVGLGSPRTLRDLAGHERVTLTRP